MVPAYRPTTKAHHTKRTTPDKLEKESSRKEGGLMNHSVRTIIYPVKDVTRAKAMFRALLATEPHADAAYYVGFKVGDQEIGLLPNGHDMGMTGPVGYYHIDDIKQRLQSLVEAGAQVQEDVHDVGGGRLIASVKDPDGNVIGLLQDT
jgi:predicted enzyme related to lactoylglutathione lyase